MNTTKVDTTNITAAEFLRMRDRCCQLEQKNAELTDTINRMHGGCERAIELRRLLDELFGIKRDQVVSDDEIREMKSSLRTCICG